jgi:hypothetical protein
MTYEIGDRVRDTKWDGTHTGTIVNIDGDDLFVQWHGTCVEDQLTSADVIPWHMRPVGRGIDIDG